MQNDKINLFKKNYVVLFEKYKTFFFYSLQATFTVKFLAPF